MTLYGCTFGNKLVFHTPNRKLSLWLTYTQTLQEARFSRLEPGSSAVFPAGMKAHCALAKRAKRPMNFILKDLISRGDPIRTRVDRLDKCEEPWYKRKVRNAVKYTFPTSLAVS